MIKMLDSIPYFLNPYLLLYAVRNVSLMASYHLYRTAQANRSIVILAFLTSLTIIFGSVGVYLVEHGHRGANITNLGDAFWWAIVTLATVGYGDYYPVTAAGRLIAVSMMLLGIGMFALLVSTLAHRRLQREESKLESRTEVQPIVLGHNMKTAIKDSIDRLEKLTEGDIDTLIITMKGLRRTLLEESKISYKCSRCGTIYHSKPKFCSNCGLELT